MVIHVFVAASVTLRVEKRHGNFGELSPPALMVLGGVTQQTADRLQTSLIRGGGVIFYASLSAHGGFPL